LVNYLILRLYNYDKSPDACIIESGGYITLKLIYEILDIEKKILLASVLNNKNKNKKQVLGLCTQVTQNDFS
jgi:hypothetical protein